MRCLIFIFACLTFSGCKDPSLAELNLRGQTPNLAVTTDGSVVLSYLVEANNTTSLRHALFDHGEWQLGGTIVEKENLLVNWADFPSVVPVSEDLWVAHWLERMPGEGYSYQAMLARSNDAGHTWGTSVMIHDDVSSSEHGFVSLYSTDAGAIGAVWLDGSEYGAGLEDPQMQLRSAVFSQELSKVEELIVDGWVCDCCQTDVIVYDGAPVVVYRNRGDLEIRDISIARFDDGLWHSSAVAEDGWQINGCPVNGPGIDVEEGVMAVAWFTAHPEDRVYLAFSLDGGRSFGAKVLVSNNRPVGRVDVLVTAAGDALVSWLEMGSGALNVARVQQDGETGEPIAIAKMATHRGAGFPQMVQNRDSLVFAWTDTSDELPKVRTTTISIDTLN
jgi:hypothetical protein